MEWQPIETAPKDGTAILCADLCDYSGWNLYVCCYHRGMWWSGNTSEIDGDMIEDFPTHWMPLPSPPESREM